MARCSDAAHLVNVPHHQVIVQARDRHGVRVLHDNLGVRRFAGVHKVVAGGSTGDVIGHDGEKFAVHVASRHGLTLGVVVDGRGWCGGSGGGWRSSG